MAISIFDLFKVGIGPSSSHTVGPMRAAYKFAWMLQSLPVHRVVVQLYGSLGLTGVGHGSDRGVLLGLLGYEPHNVPLEYVHSILDEITQSGILRLGGHRVISFHPQTDLLLHRHQSLPQHPNGMQFSAYDAQDQLLLERFYFSVGGGFITGPDLKPSDPHHAQEQLPYLYQSANQLLALCQEHQCTIAEITHRNERFWRDDIAISNDLHTLWETMQQCVQRGCGINHPAAFGHLQGLNIPRRAAHLHSKLSQNSDTDPLHIMDWVNCFAMAVNEENAASGRVVTAPTNGAAGVIPAVLHYYDRFIHPKKPDYIKTFLLTSGAIGLLYKLNASISGAEVGCQGEVGVACSMAAAGLAAVLGGSPAQIENAAEIGMEHHLGMTCDPIGGLVQIPCIERNAMGAMKAINAARLALSGSGTHMISLDAVIQTMRETGRDMLVKYKETSLGGLALAPLIPVNRIEC